MGAKMARRAEVTRRGFMRCGATGLGAIAMTSGLAEGAQEQMAKQRLSLNIIYPNHAGARFDVTYYRTRHIPLAMRIMNADSVMLIEGVPMGDTAPPYVMICHFEFASAEALAAAVAKPGMAEVRSDVARFTDIQQIVMMAKA